MVTLTVEAKKKVSGGDSKRVEVVSSPTLKTPFSKYEECNLRIRPRRIDEMLGSTAPNNVRPKYRAVLV